MADFWNAAGTIEAMGNAEIKPDGLLYSVIRIRQPNGQYRAISNFMVARQCHLLVNVGAEVALVGFVLEGKHVLVALKTEGETVDDIDAVLQSKKTLRLLGYGYGGVAVLLCWTVIMPLVLLVQVIRVFRNAGMMPSLQEIEAQVAALDRG